MTQAVIQLIAGVLFAWWGGEWFVRGLLAAGRWLRVPAVLVGVTVGAFATSAPELAVGIKSGIDGIPQLSLGDALGSNVANVALFLALGLLISGQRPSTTVIHRDFYAALLAPVLVALLIADGELSRYDAILMLLAFSFWVALVVRAAFHASSKSTEAAHRPTLSTTAMGIAGLLLLFLAGHFIVISSRYMAQAAGVSPFIIGTVLVAVATGTPELATTLVAKLRGHHDLGVAGIYGSNVFNALLILPVVALINPIRPAHVSEVMIALAFGLLTTVATYPRKGLLGRDRGLLLLALYAGFVASMWLVSK